MKKIIYLVVIIVVILIGIFVYRSQKDDVSLNESGQASGKGNSITTEPSDDLSSEAEAYLAENYDPSIDAGGDDGEEGFEPV